VSKFFKIFGKKSKAAGRLTKKWWNMITKKNRKQKVKTENPEEIDPIEKRKRELREKINKYKNSKPVLIDIEGMAIDNK